MPARWNTGLALLALSISGQLGAEPLAPQAAIERCASLADAKVTGLAALSRPCPGVGDALDQLRLTARLPPDWRKTLTAGGLADVDALVRRYAGSPASAAPPAAGLRSIAAGLVPPQPPPSWFDRIRGWIRHWTDSLLHRTGQWLRSLGPALRHARHPLAIFLAVTALLLTAVVVLLAFELRGTGLLRSFRRAARRQRAAAATEEAIQSPSREPDWARLRERPSRILQLLVDTLTRAHRLRRDRHLTCRELETAARFETEFERDGFARVARLAERELYGPPGATLLSAEALREAQILHARLLAAARTGGDIGS
ncbi:MAG TPA: hypothetical protein VGT07_09445 [Steroidobacteraceae bacterium]|nr:hypothetical protein [Steroidobacteraceae bacterium]